MWCWRPAEIGPPPYTYEVVVSCVGETKVRAVDLPLLLSQTKSNWSLAANEAVVRCATHDMVAHCGAGGQLKLGLLSTPTRL
jgi:hypothetical protein